MVALFGTAAHVRWLHHLPKPDSGFVHHDHSGPLPNHSVLSITLPNGTVYIYDGTCAQYGKSCWLMLEKDYVAKYVQSAVYLGKPHPFWLVDDDNTREDMRTESRQVISSIIKETLETLD